MSQKNSLQILNAQLRHFGLNPGDWELVRQSAEMFLVVHRKDRDLCFLGRARVKPQKVEWETLQLQSI